MRPPFTTALCASYFKAGLTMQAIAEKYMVPRLTVEQAIRRWMVTQPEGKQS